MSRLSIRWVILLLALTVAPRLHAQEAPFHQEIAAFKTQDSIQPPPAGAILFVGSSSFRFWKDLQASFPGYTVINRGFGGSTLPDVIHYADDIIFPYRPVQIVIYCGDNDLAASDSITPQIVFNRFKLLYTTIRSRMKAVNILYVSIKPSPSRERLMPRMEVANGLIEKFLHGDTQAAFVDVYHLMLSAEGRPVKELFIADMLHMNAKGYAIWQKAIRPYLVQDTPTP